MGLMASAASVLYKCKFTEIIMATNIIERMSINYEFGWQEEEHPLPDIPRKIRMI